LKVADSTYLLEGILSNAGLFENETFVSPDLVCYEVVNAVWKHDTLLRDLKNPEERIELFLELVSNGSVQLVRPDRKLLNQTYALSAKHEITIYDSVFIALALQLNMELATFDSRQSTILRKESRPADEQSGEIG
jgi:predicted nucleic acid-binding protein